jgi:hypothetical protein
MTDNIADDIIRGATAIADYTGDDVRRIYYLAERGMLPGGFRIGRIIHLRKSTYRREIEKLEQGAGR